MQGVLETSDPFNTRFLMSHACTFSLKPLEFYSSDSLIYDTSIWFRFGSPWTHLQNWK
jgi:hypothetical protein